MAISKEGQADTSPAALQTFLALNSLAAESSFPPGLHDLALQIAHNLRHQHSWTDIRLHLQSTPGLKQLTRPLLSGIPPQRLYVHPDEQIALLQKQKDEGRSGMPDLEREREWVLPSHLRARWSLERFGEVFDAIAVTPSTSSGQALFGEEQRAIDGDTRSITDATGSWRHRLPKRMLLATVDDDSTVVFYIVHDGVVKPRQN